jgi:hypothetical protein
MSLDQHIPQRPTWLCQGCLRPWPCEQAKQHLMAEYNDTPASLKIYLEDMAAWAAYDLLGSGTTAAVRERIVSWPSTRSE